MIEVTGAPTREWLRSSASGRWDAFVVNVTPDLARRWLSANTSNRPLRKSHSASMARVMRAGEWKLTHQGVAFSEDGRLLDGQHRLHSVIDAGCAVQMLIFVGIPNDVFGALDRGLKRQLRDDLAQDARIVDQISFLVRLHLASAGPSKGMAVSPVAAQSCLIALQDSVLAVLSAAGGIGRNRTTAGARAAVTLRYAIASDEDRVYLLDQWRAWVSLDVASMSRSIQTLLRRVEYATGEGSQKQNEIAASVWRGFDPAYPHQSDMVIRDRGAVLSEMRTALRELWSEARKVTGEDTAT